MKLQLRTAEVIRAVDEVLRRIERWLNDLRGGPIVPEDIELAIRSSVLICDREEVPESIRDLAIVAVPRLAEELRGYRQLEHGKVRIEDGAPGPGFWAAAKALATTRFRIAEPRTEPLEPVSQLLRQGVTYEQIAHHIYGRRGVGPFVQPNGAVDKSLIDKEAKEPGAVIPAEWIPPWHRSLQRQRESQFKQRLDGYESRRVARHYDDPATAEQMLRDGAFIQQVEVAKGMTREEVLQTALNLGLTAVDGPGYRPGINNLVAPESEDEDSDVAIHADRQALKEIALEMYLQSGQTRGAHDIALELRKRGHMISTNVVAATIGHWKRKTSLSNVSDPIG